MRSKWRRYSSSRASRSPACARATSSRISVAVGPALVEASVIPLSRARSARTLRAEAHARFAREALHVDDPAQDDRVPAVLGVELVRSVGVRRVLPVER